MFTISAHAGKPSMRADPPQPLYGQRLRQTVLGYMRIDLFTTRHKVVHNGGPLNFKGLLFDKKTNYLAQILQSLSYKVCSIILPKFNTFGLFILMSQSVPTGYIPPGQPPGISSKNFPGGSGFDF